MNNFKIITGLFASGIFCETFEENVVIKWDKLRAMNILVFAHEWYLSASRGAM